MIMPGTHPNLIAITTVFLVCCASFATPAIAQDPADLKQENVQLKDQVRKLSEELKAAQDRIAALERQIEQLKLTLNQSSEDGSIATSPTRPTTQASEKSKPEDNPLTLFRAMEMDYAEATGDLEIGELGDRNRTTYLRAVERWIAASNRQYRSRIEWQVTIFEQPQSARPTSLKLLAVDKATGETVDVPFTIALDRQLTRRLRKLEQKGELDTFILKGILTPRLRLRPRSETSDPFNNPRLVGPFAAFGFTIEVNAIVPIDKEEDSG